MTWLSFLTTALVPIVSVVSTATVAIWTKRLDLRSKRDDRQHSLRLDFEQRAGEEKKAALKTLLAATMRVRRGAEPLAGAGQTVEQRRSEAIEELYEFRGRLGLDDGVSEVLIYAAEPVRQLTEQLLDEWDRQFRDHGYSLAQLDTCKQQLVAPCDDPQRWTDLKAEEASWLRRLGEESDLDVDALMALCERTVAAARKDLRGGYGVDED
ncbi:hypothetical protein CIW49_24390 [Mycolicibacterium sp. P1-18]|uniref:hypothetical protein n=1 Tax=Mycolicibacterium sp. P1-18 TaxID=2024615 RepID=UPI0011F14E9E|nr:hypothetical protein [Mycolicibacterium sp. P1-18]KAA0094697.1 hypothetical protein CIW49_24390 [Mycolicibacterium sp. P1-18]